MLTYIILVVKRASNATYIVAKKWVRSKNWIGNSDKLPKNFKNSFFMPSAIILPC
jgi:hypothetical protein